MARPNKLGEIAVIDAITETKLREGRYKDVKELYRLYDSYMKSRLEMLSLRNIVRNRGSLNAYNCTLDLITSLIVSLQTLEGSEEEKTELKKRFESDYEEVKRLREGFRKILSE